MKPYDYLIVGSGLFGAVFAHEAHKAGKRCLVIEKRPHTGGNIYCEEVDGINVHKYGAHIFHTDNREVWNYVNRLVEFNRYTNSPIANYKGKLYNLPFNMNTFYQLWGVRTPAEARAKIQEQCREYEHITHPQNLEEQALKLCGEDTFHILRCHNRHILYGIVTIYVILLWGSIDIHAEHQINIPTICKEVFALDTYQVD